MKRNDGAGSSAGSDEQRRETEGADEAFRREMAHELRTPLQSLSMLIELMRRESERGQPSSSESFSRAKKQIDRLSSLVTVLTKTNRAAHPLLPLEPLAEKSQRSDGEGPASGSRNRKGACRILIVDDDASILDALGALLRQRYDVLVASNGEEAVDRLGSGPVDLIVLDMLMPLLDGEGALREIRGRGLRVPVIAASARGDRLVKYRELGADDFIQKPFDIGDLEEKIDRLLKAS